MDPRFLEELVNNVSNGVKDSSCIKKYRDRRFLLAYQEKSAKEANGGDSNPGNHTKVNSSIGMSLPGVSVKVKLESKNIVGIPHLVNNCNRKLEGKLFLCRNITPAFQMTSVQTIVEDPLGENAVRLALYNFSSSAEKLFDILPVGKILGIKHPWFKSTMDGGYMVRVDNPQDVIFPSQELLSKQLPDLKWRSEFHVLENSVETSKSADEWKNSGNIHFVKKEFLEATKCYTEALKLSPGNIDVLANRAAAYINLGYFYRSLEDTERSLKINSRYLKANYRKGKSLWGLKRYEEAINFLEIKISTVEEIKSSKEFADLLEKYKICNTQRLTGNYDWVKLFQTKDLLCQDDLAEFIGPVEVAEVSGKGRGLIATEDIHGGQLILLSKAFTLCHTEKNEKTIDMRLDLESKLIHFPGHDKLVKKIADNLRMEPERTKEIYQLFPGPGIPCGGKTKISAGSVDLKRIDGICTYNGFSNYVDQQLSNESTKIIGRGIWILPSFINHSCWDSNSFWIIHGDVLIVRSFKNIPKGQEILMPYIMPTEPYEKREKFFEKHGFVCSCTLCQEDRKDSKQVWEQREKFIKQINNSVQMEPDALNSLILKLEQLRPQNPNLNTAIAHPVQKVALQYLKGSQFRKAAFLMQKAFAVLQNSPLVHLAAMYAINIVAAFIYANDQNQVRKWLPILKNHLLIAYGSLEIMKIIGKDTLTEIQRCGIEFF